MPYRVAERAGKIKNARVTGKARNGMSLLSPCRSPVFVVPSIRLLCVADLPPPRIKVIFRDPFYSVVFSRMFGGFFQNLVGGLAASLMVAVNAYILT
jgi:hypothetical protein